MLVLKDLREGMAQALDWPLGDVTYRLRYLQEAGLIPTGRGGTGGAVEGYMGTRGAFAVVPRRRARRQKHVGAPGGTHDVGAAGGA